MRGFVSTLVSLSLSGSLLILLLSFLRPRLRGKISRRCQYLLWLAAALRLLQPFSPENNLMNRLFRLADAPAQTAGDALPNAQISPALTDPSILFTLPPSLRFPGYLHAQERREQPANQAPAEPAADAKRPFPWKEIAPAGLALLWLAGFLLSAGGRLWAYRRFCRQTAARLVSPDPLALETMERLRRQLSIRSPLNLWASPDLASPLLVRLGRPCVLRPAAGGGFSAGKAGGGLAPRADPPQAPRPGWQSSASAGFVRPLVQSSGWSGWPSRTASWLATKGF